MKLLKILYTSFMMGFSGAIMPGPLLAIVITSVLQTGFIASILIITGHSVLEMLMVIALSIGLKNALRNRFVTGSIGIVGGIVMLWLSYGMIKSVYLGISAPSVGLTPSDPSLTGIELVGKGIIMSLSNPYWSIWWATIGATYMLVSMEKSIVGISAFYVGHISSDFAWYSFVALAFVLGRQFISDKIYGALIILCSIFLIYMSILFLITGVKKVANRYQEPKEGTVQD